jgi:hypothetical protein
MALAIEFNDKLAGMRDEIRNASAHGSLAAKGQARETIGLQVAP